MKTLLMFVGLLTTIPLAVGASREAGIPPPAPAGPADAPKRDDPTTWVWNNPGSVPLVRHGVIFSQAMQREVGYNIYLPPDYEVHPRRRYPVVYFLHGANGNEEKGAHLAAVTQRELEAGRTGPVVWVYVNGGPFSGYRDATDSYVKAETLILDELMPAIEKNYRVRTDRAGRGICGYSMGGNGALRFATKYPERFCAVATIAGAFGFESGAADEDSVFRWSRRHAEQLRGRLPMWLFVGARDRFQADHTRLFAVLDELEFGYRYTVIADKGHHLRDLWEEVCPEFVRVMANACAPPLD